MRSDFIVSRWSTAGQRPRSSRPDRAHRTGRADLDPEQIQGLVGALGVRSELDVPLDVQGERRGVIHAASANVDAFSEDDLAFLSAVATWIGMVTHRAELVEQLAVEAERRGSRRAADELSRLTPRQREIAAAIASGSTNEEIAEMLVLTPGTVANHIERIMRRLELKNRTQVAVWATERGLYRSDQLADDADLADEP
ncbi:MAG: LuxR C-terminal-related transcriptional regulator [Chloroflexota bacterium]